MSQTLTRVRLFDIHAQLLLHRLAWTRTITLRPLLPRLGLTIVLSVYLLFGLVSIAGSALILSNYPVEHAGAGLLLGLVLIALYALLGLSALIGGPAAVLLAKLQGGTVWTNTDRTAFAVVRHRKGSPAPFNHFARSGHGATFREHLARQLLHEHGSILIRTTSTTVRERYKTEARAAGLTLIPIGRRYVRLTHSPTA